MKKLTCLLVVVLCFSYFVLQAKTTTKTTTVLFNTAKHKLTESATKELTQFIKANPTNFDYEVTIEGHTDSRGGLDYNHNLSLNRAEEVKQFLIKKGIDEKLITINYKGELDPEKPNSNDKNRTVNRRVEVIFTTYRFDNIQELEDALNPNKTSYYIVKPNEETLIKGKKGVKILIHPETFTYEDGTPVTEDIKFELTESLSYKDFISSGLLTKSPNDLLESGGMIKVAATTISGKPVKVKEDNPMIVAIPNKNRKEGMEVFRSDEGAEWTAKNQPIAKTSYRFYPVKYPMMRDKNIPLPVFVVDKSDRPEKPGHPAMSRKPHEPKEESYYRKIYWYQLNKDKIKEKQIYEYNKAMERYDKRLDKYDERVIRYNVNLENYALAEEKYKSDMIAWGEQVDLKRKAFKETAHYQRILKKHNAIYQRNLERYKGAVAEWRANKKEKMGEVGENMDKLGITNLTAMNNYVFAFNELSWINVDRFYHLKASEKQLITLKSDEIGDERVLIMFKNIGSMLPMHANVETKEYTQRNFPIKEAAVIFAYKVEEGKPLICYREIDGREDYQLDFIPTSFAEIKAILSQFDAKRSS